MKASIVQTWSDAANMIKEKIEDRSSRSRGYVEVVVVVFSTFIFHKGVAGPPIANESVHVVPQACASLKDALVNRAQIAVVNHMAAQKADELKNIGHQQEYERH